METQTLTFENLRAVLLEYAQTVRNAYQDRLITDDKISSGKLLNSVDFEVKEDGTVFHVTLNHLQDYWKYVEEGIAPAGAFSNPGWKAYPHILDWIEVKPVIPRPDKNGKLPSIKTLAYLITRKIADKGIEPTHALEETVETINQTYLPKIRSAFAKDISGHLHEWVRLD